MQRLPGVHGDFGGIDPRDFRFLPCGAFFGTELVNDGGRWNEWRYRLGPGRYRVEGEAEIRVKRYFSSDLDRLRAVFEFWSLPDAWRSKILPDGVFVAPPRFFEILKSLPAAKE
jgi:hypothetical protein